MYGPLAEAARFLQAGLAGDAERLCQMVLEREPQHPDALNLGGVAAFQTGNVQAALGLLRKAVEQRPEFVDAHNNLGNVQKAIGELREAEASYKRAIAIHSEYADAHFNLGIVLEAMGRPAEAETAYRDALYSRPDFLPACHNLGGALKSLGRFQEAIEMYQHVLAIEPRNVDALNNLGTVHYETGALETAEATYRQALEIASTHADAHYNLGVVLQELGRLDEAVAAYEQAVRNRPHYAEGFVNLGYALHQSGHLERAAKAYETAVGLDPDNPQACVNLADLRLHGADPDAAVALCDEYLRRHPGDSGVLAVKSVALRERDGPQAVRALVDYEALLKRVSPKAPAGFDSIAAFNKALSAHVRAHPSLTIAPASHATRAGKHSGELFAEPKGPMAAFETLLKTEVDAYISELPVSPDHPFAAAAPARFRLTAWAVVLEAGGHQVPHVHPSAWLSGVYYVELPRVVDDTTADAAGWIEFGQPPEHYHATTAPQLELIQPRAGLLLFFPSYFYHRTVPYSGSGIRVSIAFDVLPAR